MRRFARAAVLLVLMLPPALMAQSPAAGPSANQVRTELEQYTKFLKLLARNKEEGGSPRFTVNPRYDASARLVQLTDDEVKHITTCKETIQAIEAFKLLPDDKRKAILDAFDGMLAPAPAPQSADPQVVQFDALKEYDQRIANLALSLDPMLGVLDGRQRQAGLNVTVPSLFVPKPGQSQPAPAAGTASASPPPPPATAASGGPPPPPPLSDAADQPTEAPKLPPCSDARERVIALRKLTQDAQQPIDNLVSAGERALANRYFTLSKDALEKAAERLAELERQWRDIAESLKAPAYSNQDLLSRNCTDVLTTALTNAIALNATLTRIYPLLGQAFTELGQADRAAKEIAKATQISPYHARTWSDLGYAYLRSEQSDQAIRAFLHAVELDTYVPEYWLGLAKAYARKKENQIAIHYIRRAISKGFSKFEQLAADPDFASLQGIQEFDDMVYLVPGAQPFPR